MNNTLSRIPKRYQPGGLPLRWQDEASGVLSAAVLALWDHFIKHTPITVKQTELVRDYLEYYINAPCWATGEDEDLAFFEDFSALKERIKRARTPEEIYAWIKGCFDAGLDPL